MSKVYNVVSSILGVNCGVVVLWLKNRLYCYTICTRQSIVERVRQHVLCNECSIFFNIKLLSSDFYFNGIGLVLMKQCYFIENSILNAVPVVVT
jgi:putative flippase GtrA